MSDMRGVRDRIECKGYSADGSAECRGRNTSHFTVGGAESQALSAHATYHNVNFVDYNVLVEVSCVVTQINKTSHPP
jgi:hypothetical protein